MGDKTAASTIANKIKLCQAAKARFCDLTTMLSLIAVIFALTAAPCSSFSVSANLGQAVIPDPVSLPVPFDSLKRSFIKKQLIEAAEQKDESRVLALVNQLSQLNPTDCPTLGLAGFKGGEGDSAPLNGPWRLLFTNAKDAEAPARTEKPSREGESKGVVDGAEITTGQRINASKGECVNFIQLEGDNPNSPFDELEITIKMTPLTETRVRLDFLHGRVTNEKAPLPFLRNFKFSFPPAFVGDTLARLKGRDPSTDPPAYFDVLYIDNQIRVHRTGEGKIFVQIRGD